MQKRITPDEIQAAARHLTKSTNGRAALQWLCEGLEGEGLDLDLLDQRAFLALLGGVWHGRADAVAKTIRETLGTRAPAARAAK